MGLPKQKHAIFSITIPSSGEVHKFRPFTVKEDNILTQAKESEEPDIIINAVLSIIENCFMGKLDVYSLASFDVEYILTNIRAKSVGEEIDLLLGCSFDTEHKKTIVRVDITKPQVVFPEGHTKNIPLYDNVGVIMRYPTLKELLDLENSPAIDAILSCVDSIYDGDEVFPKADYTKKELIEWIESLDGKQVKKIKDKFFDKTPSYQLDIEYNCVECGQKNTRVIKGLNSFFI